MTEAEWLTCTVPEQMFACLRAQGATLSVRKGRLFCCACCRRIWQSLYPEARAAIEVAERHADGLATDDELTSADEASMAVLDDPEEGAEVEEDRYLLFDHYCCAIANCCNLEAPDEDTCSGCAALARDEAARLACPGPPTVEEFANVEEFPTDYLGEEWRAQCGLLQDVRGNPFRRSCLDPGWVNARVRSLAEKAYAERSLPDGTLNPTNLALLAGALEEAGCADAAILGHCRDPGPHVRGCWAVDLLLGKE